MTWRCTRCAGPLSNVDPSGAKAKGRTAKFSMDVAEEAMQIGSRAAGEKEQTVVFCGWRDSRVGKLEEDVATPDWGFWQVDLTTHVQGRCIVEQ